MDILVKNSIDKLKQYLQIDFIGLCSCGAITIDGINLMTGDKFSNSFMCDHHDIKEAKEKWNFKIEGSWGNCNHCVNHWGLDLCSCGSGENYKDCDGGLDCCGKAYQKLGV